VTRVYRRGRCLQYSFWGIEYARVGMGEVRGPKEFAGGYDGGGLF